MVEKHIVDSLETWFYEETDKIPVNSMQFAWVGQAGFLFKTKNIHLGIDLYLSDSLARKYQGGEFPHKRMVDIPISPDSLTNLDVVLCSHGHTDHMDKETLTALFSDGKGPLVIAPRYEVSRLLDMGIPSERIVGLSEGESFLMKEGIAIHAIPAAHEELTYDSWGQIKALGFVVDMGFVAWYHSGDTVRFPSLTDSVRNRNPSLCFLPVNGKKPHLTEKGIIGNLSIAEAGTLAKDMGASLLIPHHFGMFDFNTVAEDAIISTLSDQGWKKDATFILPSLNTIYTYTHERK
ncbi:MBL fold metallo-hydrolase [uncultured Sphaerochaeta sp.]|uniref:MBL fold metallo-hydrolase n=1 Tax=uncultured Sphaerochaeta sp. TaxID=886478 RepID=UPI002A0A743D|nr:MBL fold metallo-hydrolase [uncultured Sphaerochaeta sp.]